MSSHMRPLTPDSPLASSLHRATSTIDQLTLALSNFSRIASPEPPNVSTCCCGRADCETSKVWGAFKAKLESRLVLSAEVGQALLERHEALISRLEASQGPELARYDTMVPESPVDARVAELVKELLEKRLTGALVNNEVTETSNRTLIQELDEARTTVVRLTAQHARSIGLENRLATALQEKDDLQQERDSASHRSKLADARIVALKEKCTKLQAQANRLRDDLDMQRTHRQGLSQEVLSDARQRLEQLQYSQLSHNSSVKDAEVTKVLESLVADNEALKRDNAELQNLLTETREDLRALQEEAEERRANGTSSSRHRVTNSGQSFNFSDTSGALSPTFHIGTAPSSSVLHSVFRNGKPAAERDRRSMSVERTSRRPFEPLTPETDRRPLSPTDSHVPAGTKWTSFAHPVRSYPSSHHSVEVDDDSQRTSPERTKAQKSLLSLMRSRGVQTDLLWNGSSMLGPSPVPRNFGDRLSIAHDWQSESSSTSDGQSSALSALIERTTLLLNRISQADALTLTNRLKRQHLLGADVSHLSRTTVGSILHDAGTLRAHFRAFLEDDKATMTCTRRDLRALLKLIKDSFAEMGQMRVTLNDVILDPSVAAKVSDMALHPAKAAAAANQRASEAASGAAPSAPSWIAPISKLLGLPVAGGTSNQNPAEKAASRALSPPVRGGSQLGRGRPPPRIVPKREAALSASAMTVNVEFSGAGRAVTNTHAARPEPVERTGMLAGSSSAPDVARSVMGIFAGAPRVQEGADPWIVVPRASRADGAATIGRVGARGGGGRDAPGAHTDRRGLSDTSIHTTFVEHGDAEDAAREGEEEEEAVRGRGSVLLALSRTMQSFRLAGPAVSRPETPVPRIDVDGDGGSREREDGDGTHTPGRTPPRAIAPGRSGAGLFRGVTLPAWLEGGEDVGAAAASYYYGSSPREDTTFAASFCAEDGYLVLQGHSIAGARAAIPQIARLLAAFRAHGFPVFHTREGHRADLSTLAPRERFRACNNARGLGIGDAGPLGRLLVRGERGHAIVDALAPVAGEPVVDKPGRSAFKWTDLGLLLQVRGVRALVCCGVTTDVCVGATMREANDLGYECLLVEDATGAAEEGRRRKEVESVVGEGGIFGAVASTDAVVEGVERWARAQGEGPVG
ncbi:hypothetical protein A0H81_09758 [Grifola frondosa]|uniref:Isochorismatase-like domain-containing protein n=1 Tax=Grifola frondosa TaxID=5627 RepID=A0A1C7LZX8_GRIFR|nr:hypothetical protein A0H81_09758 [Grifola frondosa]